MSTRSASTSTASNTIEEQLTSYAATSQLKANVKGKFNYLQNSFDGILKLAKKLTAENHQLKVLVGVLLHFKHMFLFVKNSGQLLLEEELDELLGVDSVLFRADLRQCLALLDQFLDSPGSASGCREFVQKRESYYDDNRKYCAFLEEEGENLLRGNGWRKKGDQENLPPQTTKTHHRSPNQQQQKSASEISQEEEIYSSFEGDEEEQNTSDEGDDSNDADFTTLDTERNFMKRQTSTSTATTSTPKYTPKRSASTPSAANDSGFFTPASKKSKRRRLSTELEQAMSEVEEEECDNADVGDNLKCPVEECLASETTFAQKSDLKAHLLEVHGISPVVCFAESCSAAFENQSLMMIHLKEHHSLDTPVFCDLCESSTQSFRVADFEDHIISEHQQQMMTTESTTQPTTPTTSEGEQQQQENQHCCCWSGCSQSFSSPSELSTHAQGHVNCASASSGSYRRYRCIYEACTPPYITENRSHLVRHIRSRHFGLPRTQKEQQRLHIEDYRNPNDFVGLVGGAGREEEVTPEMQTLLQLPYHCRWLGCEESFGSRFELREHLQVHVTRYVRRAVCSSCGYSSEHRNHVLRHIRSKHLGLPRSAREQRLKGIVDDRDPKDWMQLVEVEVLLKKKQEFEGDTTSLAMEDVGNGAADIAVDFEHHGKIEEETDYGGDDEDDNYDETM